MQVFRAIVLVLAMLSLGGVAFAECATGRDCQGANNSSAAKNGGDHSTGGGLPSGDGQQPC
jgi:hypothetical protein